MARIWCQGAGQQRCGVAADCGCGGAAWVEKGARVFRSGSYGEPPLARMLSMSAWLGLTASASSPYSASSAASTPTARSWSPKAWTSRKSCTQTLSESLAAGGASTAPAAFLAPYLRMAASLLRTVSSMPVAKCRYCLASAPPASRAHACRSSTDRRTPQSARKVRSGRRSSGTKREGAVGTARPVMQ
eukprot:scaffold7946_cov116-Isochrysis_galbana.AAC.3